MNIIEIVLLAIVTFIFAIDQFSLTEIAYRPIVACPIIGLILGDVQTGLVIGGTYELMMIGNMPVGGAQPPNAVLGSVVAMIFAVKAKMDINAALGACMIFATFGQYVVTLTFTVMSGLMAKADKAAEEGSFAKIDFWQYVAICMQGLRIAIPAALILAIGAGPVRSLLDAMPTQLTDGLSIGGGMVVAVGYAMVINMMASREVWPFFAIGFVLATVTDLTLIGLGTIGISMALIYLKLSKSGGNGGSNDGGGSSNTGDPVGDIIDNY